MTRGSTAVGAVFLGAPMCPFDGAPWSLGCPTSLDRSAPTKCPSVARSYLHLFQDPMHPGQASWKARNTVFA